MRTIILTCHYSSGWLQPHIMEEVINNHDYYHISNWPVYNLDNIKHRGMFYMMYIGKNDRFLMMKGKFESAPHRNLYSWEGKPHQRSWVGLDIEQFIHYKRGPILEANLLSKAIPTVDWWRDHQELVLTEEESEKLEQVWERHVVCHSVDFQNPALVRHFEEEYQKMGIGERAKKRIVGLEKLDAFFGADRSCLHDAVVTKFDYDRDKMELTVWVEMISSFILNHLYSRLLNLSLKMDIFVRPVSFLCSLATIMESLYMQYATYRILGQTFTMPFMFLLKGKKSM